MAEYCERRYLAEDGLSLYYRDYGDPLACMAPGDVGYGRQYPVANLPYCLAARGSYRQWVGGAGSKFYSVFCFDVRKVHTFPHALVYFAQARIDEYRQIVRGRDDFGRCAGAYQIR